VHQNLPSFFIGLWWLATAFATLKSVLIWNECLGLAQSLRNCLREKMFKAPWMGLQRAEVKVLLEQSVHYFILELQFEKRGCASKVSKNLRLNPWMIYCWLRRQNFHLPQSWLSQISIVEMVDDVNSSKLRYIFRHILVKYPYLLCLKYEAIQKLFYNYQNSLDFLDYFITCIHPASKSPVSEFWGLQF
jgi:hypothetical protein